MRRKAKIEYWLPSIPDEIISVDPESVHIKNGHLCATKYDQLNGVPYSIQLSKKAEQIKDFSYVEDELPRVEDAARITIVFRDGSEYSHDGVDPESIEFVDGWLIFTVNDGDQSFGYPKDGILRVQTEGAEP